jgi:hypothetical protein
MGSAMCSCTFHPPSLQPKSKAPLDVCDDRSTSQRLTALPPTHQSTHHSPPHPPHGGNGASAGSSPRTAHLSGAALSATMRRDSIDTPTRVTSISQHISAQGGTAGGTTTALGSSVVLGSSLSCVREADGQTLTIRSHHHQRGRNPLSSTALALHHHSNSASQLSIANPTHSETLPWRGGGLIPAAAVGTTTVSDGSRDLAIDDDASEEDASSYPTAPFIALQLPPGVAAMFASRMQ